MRKLLTTSAILGALALAVPAFASISISLHGATTAEVSDFRYTVDGSKISIYETWNTNGLVFLEMSGLELTANYTVCKYVKNGTGTTWTSFANELLDPYVKGTEDDTHDPQPYPGFVPAGFSTSSDFDGLSFAQGSGIPRTSTSFSSVFSDELTDARDFIDYFDGSVADGSSDLMSFGLRDNGATENQPFLLAQRANARSRVVPEPGTMLLLGAGLIGLVALRRK